MPTKPQVETVTMTVDGKEIQAHKGEMVIAAAERAGVYIPRFCWHPRMKEVGMCRMCVVDIQGPRGWALQPACYVPVNAGMVVDTQTDRVKKAQDGILEFLLINHPLDCPVCDKGGECPLQDTTLAFGPGESRMIEEKRHFEKPVPINDLVHLDRERCIMCSRCTRFADEVAGDPFIQIMARGNDSEINIFPDDPFSSYYSGNTVQICPVGALTADPYRFKARPWDLEQVESTCTSCSVGCRVAVQSSQNELTRYLGLDSEPVNQSWLCDKGRFDHQAVSSDERVTAPLVRKGGELVEVSWAEALDAAATGLGKAKDLHGPGSLAVLGGARLANEDAYAWARFAKAVLGTDNVDCQLADGLPAEVVLALPRATIDDACWADTLILLAPDLKEELPVLHLRVRDALLNHGVKVIELSSRASTLVHDGALGLHHTPGSAPAVVAAVLADTDPAESVAGVAKEHLARARGLLGADRSVVVVLGRPSLAESADFTVQAALALHAARPEATFLPALRRANVMGAIDMGLAPGLLPGRTTLDDGKRWFAEAWGSVPSEAGVGALEICRTASVGQLQGLVLLGADPLTDLPDTDLGRRAVEGAGFVVAVDTFLTASSRLADVVLPAAAYAERAGTTTNIEGRVSRLRQKVVSPGVCWPDWMIAGELAVALGLDMRLDSLDAIAREIERVATSHEGFTPGLLAQRENRDGVVVPLTSADPAGGAEPPTVDPSTESGVAAVEAHRVDENLPTVSEAPAPAADAPPADEGDDADAEPVVVEDPGLYTGDEGEDATGEHFVRPPVLGLPEAPATAAVKPDGYRLRLASSRTLYDGGTLVAHSPHLAKLGPALLLHCHPSDLTRFSLREGDTVQVTSSRTSMSLPVTGDARVPKGACWLPWNAASPGAGDLIDSSSDVCDLKVESA
jgi:NADH-quinone oxidoreductase subunit G